MYRTCFVVGIFFKMKYMIHVFAISVKISVKTNIKCHRNPYEMVDKLFMVLMNRHFTISKLMRTIQFVCWWIMNSLSHFNQIFLFLLISIYLLLFCQLICFLVHQTATSVSILVKKIQLYNFICLFLVECFLSLIIKQHDLPIHFIAFMCNAEASTF